MPDKNDPSVTAPAPIAHGGVVELQGRDALAFAQAQCMNDVALLGDGRWQWNGWLSPRGRVIALFALIRLDAETLWLWLPDHSATALAERMQRFVFRSRVTLRPRTDLRALAEFVPNPGPGAERDRILREGAQVRLDLSGAGAGRLLHLGENAATAVAGIDPDADRRWRLQNLRHGLPRLGEDAIEAYTPHMLSLQRLSAFSVRKGCYPGQEVVSRTHYLGQAKRELVRLAAPAPLAEGAQITGMDHSLGSVLNAVATDEGAGEVLAVLPVERPARLVCQGLELRTRPLLGGLERPCRD